MTTGSSTALLHAAHCWPNIIHASLWLDATSNYFNIRHFITKNFKPKTYHGRNKISATYDSSPLSRFSGSKVEANLDHFNTFGSPVYVPENSHQSDKYHNKLIIKSRFVIYFSRSHHHVSNIPLVLNTQTGNVSPKFHCVYDNEFDTCKRGANFK